MDRTGEGPREPDDAGRPGRTLRSAARGWTALLLVAAPWWYGGVEPPARELLLLGAGLLLLLLAGVHLLSAPPRTRAPNAGYAIAGVCLGLFLLLCVVQTLPLPRGLLHAIAPLSAEIHPGDGAAPISLHAGATREALLWIVASFAFFLAAPALLRRGRQVSTVAGIFAAAAGVLALYALLAHLSGERVSLHFPAAENVARARGPFVNPNHLAAWLGLMLPAPLVVLLLKRSRASSPDDESLLLRASDFVTDLSRRYWKILAFGALTAAVLALVFTLSRAGIVAGALGTVVFLAAFVALRRRRAGIPAGRLLIAVALLACIASAALWLGLEPVIDRYAATDLRIADRLEVWRASLGLWRESPALGTGLGTFSEAFPLVQPPALAAHYTWPHNEYVGLLVECGAVGSGLLLLAILAGGAGFLNDLIRKPHRRRRQLAAAWALGAAVAAGFHAFFEFAVHMPSVGFLLAFLLGLGPAALSNPLPDEYHPKIGEKPPMRRKRRTRRL